MKHSYNKGTAVLVNWVDSCCINDSWVDAEYVDKKFMTDALPTCRTTGFVLGTGADFLVLAASYNGDQYGSVWKIPLGCILDVVELNYVNYTKELRDRISEPTVENISAPRVP